MKISTALRLAQDALWDGVESDEGGYPRGKDQFICLALKRAYAPRRDLGRFKGHYRDLPAVKFLAELGMPLSGAGFSEWSEGSSVPDADSQPLRYAWLELAIAVAEEEGL